MSARPARAPDPQELQSISERVNATWQSLFRAIEVTGSVPEATRALRDFQGHLDHGYFAVLYRNAETEYITALETLRIFKDRAAVLAARWTATGRVGGMMVTLAGIAVALANLLSNTTSGSSVAWGVYVGILLVFAGMLFAWLGEYASKRWDGVLRDFDAFLTDARKQGPGK